VVKDDDDEWWKGIVFLLAFALLIAWIGFSTPRDDCHGKLVLPDVIGEP